MMLRILFFFVLTIINNIETATNVSGVLIQNTIWTADGTENPYNLVGDVQIPFNSTLTIRPGVMIFFNYGDYEILVKGFLRIEGTDNKLVVFQGGTANHKKWMIKFQSTQLSLSSISYASFFGPKQALQLVDVPEGIQENNGTLIVQSSTFYHFANIGANGAYPRSSNPSVPAMLFELCNFYLMNIQSIGADSEPITITNSELDSVSFYPRESNDGIQINNCNLSYATIYYDLSVSRNIFRLNNSNIQGLFIQAPGFQLISYEFIVGNSIVEWFDLYRGYYAGSTPYASFIIFEQSTITYTGFRFNVYHSSEYLIYYNVIYRDCFLTEGTLDFTNFDSPILLQIENSELRNINIIGKRSPNPTRISDTYLTVRRLVMRNVTFIDGSINFPNGQSEIYYSTITLATPPLLLNGSSIISCSSISRSSSISMQNTIGINATGLILYRSTIKDFAIGIYTYPTYNLTVNITDTNFIGNPVYNIENKAIYDIYAQGVYWGTNNSRAIQRKINDYWKDINYGIVQLSDSASAILDAEASCPPYTG